MSDKVASGTSSAKPRTRKQTPKEVGLWWHARGGWAKRVHGKVHYFGRDDQTAVELWLSFGARLQSGDLQALPARSHGAPPSTEEASGLLTVRELCNRFLAHQRDRVEKADLELSSYRLKELSLKKLAKHISPRKAVAELAPSDFRRLDSALLKLAPTTRAGERTRIRELFSWALAEELIDKPIRFGNYLKKPSKQARRKRRAQRANGQPYMFGAGEVRSLLAECDKPVDSERFPGESLKRLRVLKCCVLLGVNAGFGNSEIGRIKFSDLDLAAARLESVRPKTHVPRKAVLWPETVAAVQAWLAVRPPHLEPMGKDHVFLTPRGKTFYRQDRGDEFIGKRQHGFPWLCERAGVESRGRGFYALRHTFETIAGETLDQAAVDCVMGHERPDMASNYREKIDWSRIEGVCQHVRCWALGEVQPSAATPDNTAEKLRLLKELTDALDADAIKAILRGLEKDN